MEENEFETESGERQSHKGKHVKDAPKQVWGYFEKVLNRKEMMSSRRQNVEKVCTIWVNMNLKCPVTFPSTQVIHYKPKRAI